MHLKGESQMPRVLFLSMNIVREAFYYQLHCFYTAAILVTDHVFQIAWYCNKSLAFV